MKLLTKTSLIIITISVFIIFASNYMFFHISKMMINNYIDDELTSQMHKIQSMFDEKGWLESYVFLNSEVDIKFLSQTRHLKPVLIDTVLLKEDEKAWVPYRALRFSHQVNGRSQQITIYKSLVSSDKLVQQITFASIIMVLVFMLLIYAMNQLVFEKVWSVFFRNLSKVEKYDIKSQKKLEVEHSEIDEFEKLNTVHQSMVERMKRDYINLKELTANTSHEIQTPLAIIKGKAELLLQSENISEKEINAVNTILETANRLSKLNQSLLMISRIENNQYGDISTINLQYTIERLIENYNILIDARKFDLKINSNKVCVNINSVLVEILISNLIKNAIVHGTENGKIQINLEKNQLLICNSGAPLSIPKDELFKRFVKSSSNKNSSGLGLEIVKKICNHYQIEIDYNYQNNLHCFALDFSKIIAIC
jgi:signal transduction histidine kinase